MGINYNPRTVTDGLVLHLDAANVKSYPGSGTTWYDMSGNQINFTFVNGVTKSNEGIVLDGIDDYVYTPSHSSKLSFTNGSMTVIVWEKLISYGAYGGIISTDITTDAYWKIYRDLSQNYYRFRWGTGQFAFPSFTTNQWNMYAAVRDSTTNLSLYFNGILSLNTTVSSQTIPSQNNPITIGSYRYNDAVSSRYLSNQVIGPIQIYNRDLSPAEIKQNFQATRGRFGI